MSEGTPLEEQEPCDDAISRQAVLNLAKFDGRDGLGSIIHAFDVEQLPPVNSAEKVGKWIYMDDDNLPYQIMDTYRFECSKCRRSVTISAAHPEALLLVMYPYCNCGCKMVDIEKDNTRYDEFGFIDPFSFREDDEQNE